jgi:mannosyltransferase OCH1-like enzyme
MKIGAKGINISSELALPKQISRVLPFCCGCLILLLLCFGGSGSSSNGLFHKKPLHFPRKVWQTWKVDAFGFEEKDSKVARTWTQKNPEHRYEVLTDQNDLAYVQTHFGAEGLNRLDIVYMYRELRLPIIKADMLRYLVMYVEGGVYTDIDVEALRPIQKFIPERYDERDIDMVVGIEIDQPEFKDHDILGQKCMSFCQWTFMAKPGLPVMLTLIENIVKWLKTVAMEQRVPISEIQLDFDQVISGTGPSAFTRAILQDMSRRAGRDITWDAFHNMGESKLVQNVLVLTVEAFAAGQGHSDSGNHNAKQALVKHHYHASGWPTNHPRYSHPIHGSVENCNWDAACVKQWDDNKAAFEALPEEEQEAQIALKEQGDQQPMRKRQVRRSRPR